MAKPKKPKIVMLYPPDSTTDEINDMHLLYFRALEKLNRKYDITVVGRISRERFKETCPVRLKYVDFFDVKISSATPASLDISDKEKRLDISLRYMFNCCQDRWDWYSCNRNHKKLASRYVRVWEWLLADTDILLTTLDTLFFIYTAESVARKAGVHIIKPVNGRLVDNSVALWDDDGVPLDAEGDDGIYERFVARVAERRQIKLHTSSISDKHGLLKRMLDVPRKAIIMLSCDRWKVDCDIPDINDKYLVLFDRGLHLLSYPALHSLMYSKPMAGERYILFPLHFKWESNLSYRSPYLGQIELIYQLSITVPEGMKIYVKAHPHWRNCDQSLLLMLFLKFRSDIIRIISPDENTADLIRDSAGVAVINSTVGYEALYAGKPLIVFGHEFFRYAPGAYDIKDMNALPEAVMRMAYGKRSPCADEDDKDFVNRYASMLMDANPESVSEGMDKAFKKVMSWNGKISAR